ncbi:hypothetical protein Fcan01_17241 [Folsomia candida]|uniref:Uncharacterized protein n=1 Tax=Folsomia candida TaxID=158441 RepID=A0A226DRZ9_FOLCA|nr:hypothetical protein Fcan01_17241 [Folsomia candida]
MEYDKRKSQGHDSETNGEWALQVLGGFDHLCPYGWGYRETCKRSICPTATSNIVTVFVILGIAEGICFVLFFIEMCLGTRMRILGWFKSLWAGCHTRVKKYHEKRKVVRIRVKPVVKYHPDIWLQILLRINSFSFTSSAFISCFAQCIKHKVKNDEGVLWGDRVSYDNSGGIVDIAGSGGEVVFCPDRLGIPSFTVSRPGEGQRDGSLQYQQLSLARVRSYGTG